MENPTAIALRDSWLVRVLRALRVVRAARVQDVSDFVAGADYAAGVPLWSTYDIEEAMSAYSAFPWVVACATAVAEDLASLPIRVGVSATAEVIDGHPVLGLLARPHSRVSGSLFRRQLVVDWLLAGASYALTLGDPPVSLVRLHPLRTLPVPAADGTIYAYDYNGDRLVRYSADQVLHWSTPSWQDDPRSLLGQGLMHALREDLRADLAAAQRGRQDAAKGRPAAIWRPEGDQPWGETQIKEMRATLDRMLDEQHGGVGIIGRAGKMDVLGWSPKDSEYVERRRLTRETILAAFGVPPTRVGLPNANYATAQAERQNYWEGLRAKASLLDSEWTRLAQKWDAGIEVWHDFSSVPALQYWRTEAIQRARALWDMGIPLTEALRSEGLDDVDTTVTEDRTPPAPAPVAPPAPAAPPESAPPDQEPDQEPGKGLRSLASLFDRRAPRTAEERAAVWRSQMSTSHAPAERRLNLAMVRYLRGCKARVLARLPAKGIAGAVVKDAEATAEDLFDAPAEARALVEALGEDYARALMLGAQDAARRMGRESDWTPTEAQIRALLADHADGISATTLRDIQDLVGQALSEGWSTAELQAALQTSAAFSPMRALRVARTESTAALNAGALQSMADAEDAGVQLEQEWISARDSEVRETHAAMDGQRIQVGESWVLSDGDSGLCPGDFSDPSNVVNCRCTVIPVVSEEP